MSAKKQVQPSILSFFRKSLNGDATRDDSKSPSSQSKSPLSKSKQTNPVSADEKSTTPTRPKNKKPVSKDEPSPLVKRKHTIPDSSDEETPPVIKRRKTRTKSAYDLYDSEEEDVEDVPSDDSSDDDPEFKPDPSEVKEAETEELAETSTEMVDENEEPMDEEELLSDDEVTPVKQKRTGKYTGAFSSAKSSRKVTQSARKATSVNYKGPDDDDASFREPTSAEWPPKDPEYDFIRPENIRDKERRRPDHPDYDPTSILVPPSFLKSLTEAQRQWWNIKSENWDTVLLFKVGKFYELFQMDALIGIQELSLLPMGGSPYHSGFPEKSFNKFADILCEKGYRVARVEQTESNTARDSRLKQSGGSKCVSREICRIITPGTALPSGEINLSAPRLLFAIHQKETDQGQFIFGVAFVDCSISKFTIAQFTDDRYCSRLRTLLAYNQPIEFLLEKNNLNSEAQFVFDTWFKHVHTRTLLPDKQFLTPQGALELIKTRGYFDDNNNGEYPAPVKMMCDEADSVYLTPASEYSEMARAFGALLWYLKQNLIDEELMSLGQIEYYSPPDANSDKDKGTSAASSPSKLKRTLPSHLILDASTLAHLDIIDSELGVKYSLLGFLDHTSTRPGKRLFRSWVCSPLTDAQDINARLDAVDDLEKFYSQHKSLFSPLTSLPDLEALLSQIHKVGLKRKDHPDDRAQMFEDYDKAKVRNLVRSIDALKTIVSFFEKVQPHVAKFKSQLLKSISTPMTDGGMFPDIKKPILKFENLFDVEEARNSSIIIPASDWDSDLLDVNTKIQEVEGKLKTLLSCIKNKLGCPVKYSHTKKERYLIEVDKKWAHKVDTKKFTLSGSLKNCHRYTNKDVLKLTDEIKELEETKESIGNDTKRKLFAKFSTNIPLFRQALSCLSTFDCLLSLSRAKLHMTSFTDKISRPTIVDNSSSCYIKIETGKHPILMQINASFIPNSLELCGDKMVILTGPNMGGKSTLMRQTALLSIMAQVGSYVPAAALELTPIDRVFTRIGAYDNISAGTSTFKVEMDEASAIINNATVDSLILMDELGRGTSTHDGTAIAHSVVQYLSKHLKSRTLFSTHYHDLIDGLDKSVEIEPCHMRCIEQVNSATGHEEIIFQYKVAKGECPKSHGFNAARLAGIKTEMITLAKEKAKELSEEAAITHQIRRIMKVMSEKEPQKLRALLKKLTI